MPGALKNAVDWASRPTFGGPNAWRGKVVGIAGVGPQSYEGAHGGLLAAVALRQSTMFLEWRVIDSPKIHVLKAPEKFTEDGKLKPEVRPPISLLISRRNIYGIISGLC
jgi:chromate reductase, NAD(P)H dehydrogenase (quinone)